MNSDTDTPLHAIGGKLGKEPGRSNAGKPIMHTIDPFFILGIGNISEFGHRKYHMRNFLMTPGMPWSAVYDSMNAHLLKWWGGEELDLGPNGEFGETDDPATNMKWSGLPHLYHAAWNLMVLSMYSRVEAYHPGDDRPATTEFVGVEWADHNSRYEFAKVKDIEEAPLTFEDRLAAALKELEELGFKQSGEGDFIANEHGEDPFKVLTDYLEAPYQDDVAKPSFLNDPVRAYYANKNGGK